MDIMNRNFFAHVDPDGRGINIKIHEAGYMLVNSYLSSMDQNNFESLGAGYTSPTETVRDLSLIRTQTLPAIEITCWE